MPQECNQDDIRLLLNKLPLSVGRLSTVFTYRSFHLLMPNVIIILKNEIGFF